MLGFTHTPHLVIVLRHFTATGAGGVHDHENRDQSVPQHHSIHIQSFTSLLLYGRNVCTWRAQCRHRVVTAGTRQTVHHNPHVQCGYSINMPRVPVHDHELHLQRAPCCAASVQAHGARAQVGPGARGCPRRHGIRPRHASDAPWPVTACRSARARSRGV